MLSYYGRQNIRLDRWYQFRNFRDHSKHDFNGSTSSPRTWMVAATRASTTGGSRFLENFGFKTATVYKLNCEIQ